MSSMAEFLAKKRAAAAGRNFASTNLNMEPTTGNGSQASGDARQKTGVAGLSFDVPATSAPPRDNEKRWHQELTKLNKHLEQLSLRMHVIPADGNCMFAAFALQLHGDASRHTQLREECVSHLLEHRADYEAFLDEGETFTKYTSRMRTPGTWGGQIELQILGTIGKSNILIHRVGPDGEADTTEMKIMEAGDQCVQLAYLSGEHYNAVLPAPPADVDRPAVESPEVLLTLQELRERLARSAQSN
eukprot:GDKH01026625.1.p1 GENE.GDKH01026625.1~~GDKH01026625.1.p1  ORF type:complete len:245 (+),score=20.04 GDKH01026625.1:120-854(+)